MIHIIFQLIAFLLSAFTLISCTEVSHTLRLDQVSRIAEPAMMIRESIRTDLYPIATYERIHNQGGQAIVYIEGESRGSINSHTTRYNPTPLNPVALKMAVQDKSKNLIYISVPCANFTLDRIQACNQKYFKTHRFAPEVIASYNQVLDYYRKRYDIKGFHLVGFSGGGVVATLLAQQQPDILTLRTIAAPLDTQIAQRLSQTNSFSHSQNPSSDPFTLGVLPQHHFLGDKDEFVTPVILSSFLQEMGPSRCVRTSLISGPTHRDGWDERWPELMAYPLDCRAKNIRYDLDNPARTSMNDISK